MVARAGRAEHAACSALHSVVLARGSDPEERRNSASLEQVDLTRKERAALSELRKEHQCRVLDVGILNLTNADELTRDIGLLAQI